MNESLLCIGPAQRLEDRVHWRGEFVPARGRAAPIWFEFTYPEDTLPPPTVRPFLLAALVPAMRVGAPLRLPLPVDATTLTNLMEWQEATASWQPDRLTPVPIRCEIINQDRRKTSLGGLTAFSGGVDSSFTVVRHTAAAVEPTYRTAPLAAGLMVHGFDISLDRGAEFESAWNNSRAMLQDAGLRAFRLRTNVRSLEGLFGCSWEKDAHGIWLAATLACYEPQFSRAIIPSTYPNFGLRLPWASNSITDPLFGSDTVETWHDGAAFSKLTKVRFLAGNESVRKHLRVCWQGKRLDRNCGHCFKCMATQVCFWLLGVHALPAFPHPCSIEDLVRLPIATIQNANLVRWIREEALRQGRMDIARALQLALAYGFVRRSLLKGRPLLRSLLTR